MSFGDKLISPDFLVLSNVEQDKGYWEEEGKEGSWAKGEKAWKFESDIESHNVYGDGGVDYIVVGSRARVGLTFLSYGQDGGNKAGTHCDGGDEAEGLS